MFGARFTMNCDDIYSLDYITGETRKPVSKSYRKTHIAVNITHVMQDSLKNIGKMGESYNDIIYRLFKFYEENH